LGAVVVLVDTVHFPFMGGYTGYTLRLHFYPPSKTENVAPGITSPSRDCAPPFLPLFPIHYTQEIALHSIMAIRRLKNTRTSMRYATSSSYQFFLNKKCWICSTRIQQIQADMTYRALELLNLPPGEPAFLLDIGCGSGLSGEILDEEGYVWAGVDIAPSMLGACVPFTPHTMISKRC
jgi:hypothetical protein